MSAHPYRSVEVASAFGVNSWPAIVHREMGANLESKARPFPCIFGVAGLKADQLRFAFDDRLDAAWLGAVLVAFSRPGPVASLESYRNRMWALLRDLAAVDTMPWPAEIEPHLEHPTWEFSVAGEAIFVVCNTPAHVQRQSRRASTFTLTFQPRWVFDAIFGRGSDVADKAIGKVRRRLVDYDMLPASPALGQYGEPGVLEHEQYFLSDDNERPSCPFATLRDDRRDPQLKTEEAA